MVSTLTSAVVDAATAQETLGALATITLIALLAVSVLISGLNRPVQARLRDALAVVVGPLLAAFVVIALVQIGGAL